MKKFFISLFLSLTILLGSSCSLSYFYEDNSSYFSGIISFEEFHNSLVVDIPSVGLCVIPKAKTVYYLNDDTEIEKGDLIRIKFNQRKSQMAVMESYPAQFSGIADYIEVRAKNLILERTNDEILFSQPHNDVTNTLSVGDSLYFIKTGGKNGQAYRQLFCNAEIINIREKTTQLKLLLDKADLLEEFLSSYPSLEQSVTWKY